MDQEKLRKLHQQVEGRRKKWEPIKPTPRQVYDAIHSQVTEEDYPPTEKDLKDKKKGLKRRSWHV